MLLETTDHILGTFEPPDEGSLARERKQFQELYRHFARDLVEREPKSRRGYQDAPDEFGESERQPGSVPATSGTGRAPADARRDQ